MYHLMLHPYADKIFYIKATLELATCYKGKPYGPAIIRYRGSSSYYEDFTGTGYFVNG